MQLENQSGKLQITRFYFSGATEITAPKLSKTTPSITPVSPEALNTLIDNLSAAYAAGDIEQFMGLFSKDAQTNDRATIQGIREDYVGLFDNTSFRKIAINNLNWNTEGNTAHGEASYDVDVRPNGKTQLDHYHGQLWIQAERKEGGVRITHFAFVE